MKRLNTKEGQYGVWLGLCIGIFSTIIGVSLSIKFPDNCTPSQQHQEVMQTLTGIDSKIELILQMPEIR